MGSRSNSETKTVNKYKTANLNVQGLEGGTSNAIGNNSGSIMIEDLSGKALEDVLGFAKHNTESNAANFSDVLNFGDKALSGTLDFLDADRSKTYGFVDDQLDRVAGAFQDVTDATETMQNGLARAWENANQPDGNNVKMFAGLSALAIAGVIYMNRRGGK